MQATPSQREFADWFGASKAVGELGQPMVFYHGTDAQFERFSSSYIGQSQEGKLFAGHGFYFSDNAMDASAYGANVVHVQLRMQKTLDLRDKSEFLKAFANLIPENQEKTLAQLVHDYSEAKAALQIEDVMVKEVPHRPGFYDVQWKIAGEWQSSWPHTPSSLELSDDITGHRYAEGHALPPDPAEFMRTMAFSYSDITKGILDNGYDSAINSGSIGHRGDEYVVFSADQIMILPVATKTAEQSVTQGAPDQGPSNFSPKMIDVYGTGLRYEDGRVTGEVDIWDVEGVKGITIHEWSSRYPGHGHTKAALQWFREQGYQRIVANGVGTLDLVDGALTGDVATAYWAHMHSSGLVDYLLDDEGHQLVVAPDETVTFQLDGNKTPAEISSDNEAVIYEFNKPVLAYHGSDAEFKEFDTGSHSDAMTSRLGAYFTTDVRVAHHHGEKVGAYHLAFNNLFDIAGLDSLAAIDKMPISDRLKQELRSGFRNAGVNEQYGMLESIVGRGLRASLEAAGYDGVKYTEAYADSYIAFHPGQIKDATPQLALANDVTQSEVLSRIERLPDLKNKAGTAYTFYTVATKAIELAAGNPMDVNWAAVEDTVIRESVCRNKQTPQSVHKALSQVSPGAVSLSRQEVIAQVAQATFAKNASQTLGAEMSSRGHSRIPGN